MLGVIIIFLGCLLSAFIPRLWPVMIVFLGGLVLQGADPLLLSMVATGGAVTGTTGLWFFDSYVKQAVNRVMHHARSHWLVLAETGFVRRWIALTRSIFGDRKDKKKSLSKLIKKFEKKITDTKNLPRMMMIAGYTFQSPIPDMLIIRFIRHKMPFRAFWIAMMVGKIFAYAPFVYGVDVGALLRGYVRGLF